MRVAFFTLLGSMVVSALLMAFQSSTKGEPSELAIQIQNAAIDPESAKLNSLEVSITPPTYTKLASRKADNANPLYNKIVWWVGVQNFQHQ